MLNIQTLRVETIYEVISNYMNCRTNQGLIGSPLYVKKVVLNWLPLASILAEGIQVLFAEKEEKVVVDVFIGSPLSQGPLSNILDSFDIKTPEDKKFDSFV